MNAHEKEQCGLALFLHLYTKRACTRKNILFYPGEQHRIYLEEECLGTAFPVELFLYREKQGWRLNDTILFEDNFCFLQTGAGEEIMAVLSVRDEKLFACGKVFLRDQAEIKVGNDFRNEVFYDSFSFVKDRHICISGGPDGFIFKNCSNQTEEGTAGVYLNGKEAPGMCMLSPGDRVELLGLTLIYLPGVLVCTSFYGALRTVERRKRFPVQESIKGQFPDMGETEVEQTVIEEEQLISEEVEIELPELVRRDGGQPLLFTIGPSMTMMIPMILMAVLGSAMLGESGAGYYKLSIVMTASCAFFSVFWAVINHLYQKKSGRRENSRRMRSYEIYLEETERYLRESSAHNRMALQRKYPSCREILKGSEGRGQVFLNRTIRQRDYLFLRLGLGCVPFQIRLRLSKTSGMQKKDGLVGEAFQLAEKYRMLTEAPIGIDLGRYRIAGFTGELVYPVFLQALLQMAACHDGSDVKLVYFYHEAAEKERRIAECIKWLPHVWSQGKKLRYLAGNEKEAGELMPELTKELLGRQENAKNPMCVYVFLVAALELIRGEGIYRLFMDAKENSGVYGMFLCGEREGIPGECECLVIRDREKSEIVCYEQDSLKREKAAFEEAEAQETETYMRRLSGWKPVNGQKTQELTDKVSFLDLYQCERVEDLNCRGRWRENRTGERIKVPVGMSAGGRLTFLDIHEKFHGPHGLIAGTTGSGKSELLQTYLLSLAVSFGPEDINFFIIDYKGGGMGNMLQSLPHCAGVISNLSGSQIRRSLSSVKSENIRRQRLFGAAGVSNVTDYACLYREGRVPEPIPHLLLVIDEFAELKKEEPEFMQEIISVAQVGRSLGVHLILSTQKPAGTVDDKIWSNTRFRLCLRVADRQDSMDMLHRPEAASLTGAGQCYLQVGNDELYELFQAGYGGAEYEENGKCSEGAYMVSPTGKRSAVRKKDRKKGPTQMEAVIDHIREMAEEISCKAAKPLWMPELNEEISLAQISGEGDGKKEALTLCLGMCDDPERQKQYPLYYTPPVEGNLLLCGAPAVGKSTFLQTVLFQLCSYPPDEVCFLLAASDNAGINCFENMPGCLGNMRKEEEAECFFYHLEQLFQKRKEELKGINFLQYRKYKEKSGAFYFLIIDNYGSFRQMTEDRYEELIEKIAGEGQNYGIYLLITSLNAGSGEIPAKLFEKCRVALSLEMSDRFQYGDILRRYHMHVFPKENVKGRGLCKKDGRILEFQVPLCLGGKDDYERVNAVLSLAEKRREETGEEELPERFPVIPEHPVWREMAKRHEREKNRKDSIPIGYIKRSGNIAALPVGEQFSFLISGAEQTGKRTLFCGLIRALWDRETVTAVFDRKDTVSGKISKMAKECHCEELFWLIDSKEEWIRRFDPIKGQLSEKGTGGCILCISDLTDFSEMISERTAEILEIRQSLEQMKKERNLMPVIAILKPGREMEALGTPIFEFMKERQCGIHLGGNAAGQRTLSFDDLSYTALSCPEKPGIGYLKRNNGSKTEKICIPLYEKESKNDIG